MDAATELKFKEVDWATSDFENPFKIPSAIAGEIEINSFKGYARKMNISRQDMLRIVRFDCNEEFRVEELRCVVIGRNTIKEGEVDAKNHVLVIHRERNALGESIYVRVGVGSLKSSVVGTEKAWVTIY